MLNFFQVPRPYIWIHSGLITKCIQPGTGKWGVVCLGVGTVLCEGPPTHGYSV